MFPVTRIWSPGNSSTTALHVPTKVSASVTNKVFIFLVKLGYSKRHIAYKFAYYLFLFLFAHGSGVRRESTQARDPLWLSNPGQTSDVQNRGIRVSTKRTYVRQFFQKLKSVRYYSTYLQQYFYRGSGFHYKQCRCESLFPPWINKRWSQNIIHELVAQKFPTLC